MDNKNKYYLALKENNGRINEIDLGETLGFEDDLTRKILAQLMSEYKIEYDKNGMCNYRIIKRFGRRKYKNQLRDCLEICD